MQIPSSNNLQPHSAGSQQWYFKWIQINCCSALSNKKKRNSTIWYTWYGSVWKAIFISDVINFGDKNFYLKRIPNSCFENWTFIVCYEEWNATIQLKRMNAVVSHPPTRFWLMHSCHMSTLLLWAAEEEEDIRVYAYISFCRFCSFCRWGSVRFSSFQWKMTTVSVRVEQELQQQKTSSTLEFKILLHTTTTKTITLIHPSLAIESLQFFLFSSVGKRIDEQLLPNVFVGSLYEVNWKWQLLVVPKEKFVSNFNNNKITRSDPLFWCGLVTLLEVILVYVHM